MHGRGRSNPYLAMSSRAIFFGSVLKACSRAEMALRRCALRRSTRSTSRTCGRKLPEKFVTGYSYPILLEMKLRCWSLGDAP
eukprot:8563431-Pyramimonas_sp.AAC.1